ncbi:MAG: hypothetical protein M1822_006923 [Bathelium mastoideum]|nr:MAG: hypothetical protein M1822_006923 [Bathelium mastoideum]
MAEQSNTSRLSEPNWSTAFTKSHHVPFYVEDIDDKIGPDVRKLLENYSHVKPEEVRQHVYDIRDQLWAIRSYPCTGIGLWLQPTLPFSRAYPVILSRLKQGASLLDIGCFIGHDFRRLVSDGAPSSNLYGIDIVSHWDVGYDMFRDHDRFSRTFFEADITSPNEKLSMLNGKIDILMMIHVLHQWDWENQVNALTHVIDLSRKGALVVGFQIGSKGVNVRPKGEMVATECFWHNPETISRLWEQLGGKTQTKWRCESKFKTFEEMKWNPKDISYLGEDAIVISWAVTRID